MAGKTIEQEIVEWSVTRLDWQRALMRQLARGEVLGETDIASLADRMAQASPPPSSDPLTLADMPRGQQVRPGEGLVLRGIRDLEHVNAIVSNQQLDFAATGMTVVYGDNGSGKSGYARILKAVVRARDREEVRTNIFADTADDRPSATLLVERGPTPGTIPWPDGDVDGLASIGFFDEACGDRYLTADTEISYRPSALSIMEGLIGACDGVRAVLSQRLAENERRTARLPDLAPSSPAGKYLAGLSPSSDLVELDALCRLPPDIDKQIESLLADDVRLRTMDPVRERARLVSLTTKLEKLAEHVAAVSAALSESAARELGTLHTGLRNAETAATTASAETFEGEPLAGVGSPVWRALWSAARAFAMEGGQVGTEFPDTTAGARCVLCHQELGADAADRLRRFEQFVQNLVQAALKTAENSWAQALKKLTVIECEPPYILGVLDDIEESYATLTSEIRNFLAHAATRRSALLAAGDAARWSAEQLPPAEPAPPGAPEAAEAERMRSHAIVARDHEQQLRDVVARRRTLEDGKAIAGSREAVLAEIERLAERARLQRAKAQTATNTISTKTAALVRAHVTAVVRDRFTRETERLQLDRVTLDDLGVRKGVLRHQAAFVGAIQDAPLPRILSEGEQTALGLAGFFTEAHLDTSSAALVLDDPVCSLDHRRRARVAERLADFARDRQVIV
ncbi:hypothetical protein JYT86_00765, partial [bacterium AH-315-N03]|nr:hypothetical protein [bacterium AH-315-N03]